MATDEEPFSPGRTVGNYRIGERIGEGGMGAVWRATHLGLRRPVAIKTLRRDLASNEVAQRRFRREGEVMARIRHAHIVEVYDVGVAGETPFLVMELLDGQSLAAALRARVPWSVTELADVLVPVCSAVATAHDEHVVHRDLKPENVVLARTRDRGVIPKVLDFGIAHLADDELRSFHTGTQAVLGTPRYMSPEQVRGAGHVDARTDQYSLGVILYLGATGVFPIDEPVLYQLMHRVVQGDFKPPRAVRPDLPVEFERVILRAMANEADARYPSMRALGAALLPFASAKVRLQHADAFVDDTLKTLDESASVTAPNAPPPAVEPLEPSRLQATVHPVVAPAVPTTLAGSSLPVVPAGLTLPMASSPRRTSRAVMLALLVFAAALGAAFFLVAPANRGEGARTGPSSGGGARPTPPARAPETTVAPEVPAITVPALRPTTDATDAAVGARVRESVDASARVVRGPSHGAEPTRVRTGRARDAGGALSVPLE